MSKTLMSLLVVGVVVVGGYFALSKDSSIEKQDSTNTTAENTPEQTDTRKMAFADLLKQGGTYKCTVTQNVNNTETMGTTYMDGSMIRGEYNTKVQGMSIDSTMVVRDGYTYSWSSALPNMGFKAKVVESTGGDTSAPVSGNYSFNAEQIGEYDCEAWTADASKFAIPTNITFKDVSTE
jgi:hypothetical protein